MTDRRAIKTGDLVQVIHWPCCGAYLGRVFIVGRKRYRGTARCSACNTHLGDYTWMQQEATKAGFARPWLKRFDPLDEPAETYTTEKHKEPA